jgi:hypothetical protein
MDDTKTGPRAVFWYAADLGGAAMLVPITAQSRDQVLAGMGAKLDLVMPNLLGEKPQGFSIRLTPGALGDLSPAALVAATPFLAAAMECRARAGEERLQEEFPALGQFIAALAPPPAKPGDASVDRLFAMLDLGEAAPVADGQADTLLARQIALLLDDPALLRLEAAWRGLALLLDGLDPGVEIRLISAARSDLADQVMAALAALDAEDPMAPDAVLLAETFDPRGPDAAVLGALAMAAEAASVPLIAEAPANMTGLTLEAVAKRHDPTAAMEGPAWNAWRGLRQKEASRWLGLAWNRPWLRLAHDLRQQLDLPGFAGERLPGPAVAAIGALMGAASAAGWPSALTMQRIAPAALAEITLADGSRAAWPLEAAISGETAALLGSAGLLALAASADGRAITLPVAQSVKLPGRIGGEAEPARQRASLPFILASSRITRAITAMHAQVAASADPAEACAAALRALLAATGPGAKVQVTTLADPEEPGGAMLEVQLRLGAAVPGGLELAMDIPLG